MLELRSIILVYAEFPFILLLIENSNGTYALQIAIMFCFESNWLSCQESAWFVKWVLLPQFRIVHYTPVNTIYLVRERKISLIKLKLTVSGVFDKSTGAAMIGEDFFSAAISFRSVGLRHLTRTTGIKLLFTAVGYFKLPSPALT